MNQSLVFWTALLALCLPLAPLFAQSGADLEIFVSCPEAAQTDESVCCSLSIINNGPHNAYNMRLSATLPNTASLHAVNHSLDLCSSSQNNFLITKKDCPLGNLKDEEDLEIDFCVSSKEEGILRNQLHISSDTSDPNDENNTTWGNIEISGKEYQDE
jgi:hypothetical protein